MPPWPALCEPAGAGTEHPRGPSQPRRPWSPGCAATASSCTALGRSPPVNVGTESGAQALASGGCTEWGELKKPVASATSQQAPSWEGWRILRDGLSWARGFSRWFPPARQPSRQEMAGRNRVTRSTNWLCGRSLFIVSVNLDREGVLKSLECALLRPSNQQ